MFILVTISATLRLFFLALLSLYMICSSLFALYIVTLPNVTPMKALRSARQLVLHRRFLVLRKILFMPLALLVLGAIIMIPLIIFLTFAAMTNSSMRPKSRRYLDFLSRMAGHTPAAEQSRGLILP